MPRGRPTIARVMAWTAVFALNAALLRAFLLHEQFAGALLLFLAIQLAAWRSVRNRGRRRRFWVGCGLAGVGVTLGLIWAEVDPGAPPGRLLTAWLDVAYGWLFRWMSDPLTDWADEHWSFVLAIVSAIPELACTLLGGVVAALAVRPRREACRDADEPRS